MPKSLYIPLAATILLFASPAIATPQVVYGDVENPVTEAYSTDSANTVFLPIVMNLVRSGERLNIYYSGWQTFPSATPFHIAHGWFSESPPDELFALLDFQLQVDGVYREENFIESYLDESWDPPVYAKIWVFNFPNGMTGVHTFTGYWLGPCAAFYDDCIDPYEIVEEGLSVVTVMFVP